MKAGKTFCPHYLGGGIGLLASAHLLAGVGGDGWLEVDVNDNPLRDQFCGPVLDMSEGIVVLNEEPGLGISAGYCVDRTVPHAIGAGGGEKSLGIVTIQSRDRVGPDATVAKLARGDVIFELDRRRAAN